MARTPSQMVDITNHERKGSILSRVQRGVVVQFAGKRGDWIILKRNGTQLYAQRHDGTRIPSRAGARRRGDYTTAQDHRGGERFALSDVTHVRQRQP